MKKQRIKWDYFILPASDENLFPIIYRCLDTMDSIQVYRQGRWLPRKDCKMFCFWKKVTFSEVKGYLWEYYGKEIKEDEDDGE